FGIMTGVINWEFPLMAVSNPRLTSRLGKTWAYQMLAGASFSQNELASWSHLPARGLTWTNPVGYFSFVKTLSAPLRRFTVTWFFAASNVKTATPSSWNLSSAVASRGTAVDAPGGLKKSVEPSLVTVAFAGASGLE